MTRKAVIVLVLSLFCGQLSRASDISTSEIVSRTAEAAIACMQWTPVGLCFWLDCGWFSCRIETSLKIGHYNPDLVVSSYNELGRNPWREMRGILGPIQQRAVRSLLGRLSKLPVGSAGNRTEGHAGRGDHANLVFRETDAIGHPGGLFSWPDNLICDSQARVMQPYFLSGLDALAWRRALPEALYPASNIPGLREVGRWPIQTWGGVFPRTGWTIQAEGPKAAALTAQRAGDIVTRSNQPHIYRALGEPNNSGQRIWAPGELLENDASTGYWQMLSPVTDRDCQVFGKDDLASMSGWGGGRVDTGGDYTWNLWRPYQCCQRAGQFFLFDINWVDYPNQP